MSKHTGIGYDPVHVGAIVGWLKENNNEPSAPMPDIEAAFRTGFQAGFNATCEGFNGECCLPHCGNLTIDTDDPDVAVQFIEDAAVSEWKKTQP